MFQLKKKKKASKRVKEIVISSGSSSGDSDQEDQGHPSGHEKHRVGSPCTDDEQNFQIIPVSEALPDIKSPIAKSTPKRSEQAKKTRVDSSRDRFQHRLEKVVIL